ncbi:hypothetical protein DZC34_03325 [Clostridium botulinum]|nr:hypothetical protein DZC34_03325 [Clostridium botulinum]
MDIKTRLRERLLEIPVNSTAYREKYRLADDLNIKVEEIEPFLNELCEKNILLEKIQYYCPNCRSTTIMDNEILKEFIDEEDYCECDDCDNFISTNKNKTGCVFYDIKDKQSLIDW